VQFLVAADSNKQFRVPLDKAVGVGSIMQRHLVVVGILSQSDSSVITLNAF